MDEGFPNLGDADILGQVILCWGQSSCALYNI